MSCLGFWPNIIAQMSKSDSDSEQSYCSDDSEFNYIPGPYVIEAVEDASSETQGATSRDDAIFSGERHFRRESLFQGLKNPWALFLTKRVPEVSKSVPLIGQKNIFLANQR